MKQPGDPGHPVQFDGTGWYVNVDSGNLLHTLITQNQSTITPETSNTFIKRKPDNRKDLQKIYLSLIQDPYLMVLIMVRLIML